MDSRSCSEFVVAIAFLVFNCKPGMLLWLGVHVLSRGHSLVIVHYCKVPG